MLSIRLCSGEEVLVVFFIFFLNAFAVLWSAFALLSRWDVFEFVFICCDEWSMVCAYIRERVHITICDVVLPPVRRDEIV